MTFKRNLKFISLTIILFAIPIIAFISILIIRYQKTGQMEWADTALNLGFLVFFVSIITVPGLFLHFHYYNKDMGKSLRFRPTYFEIIRDGETNKIYYKDILRIEKHYPAWTHRNPWSDYGYIKILLTDNSTFSYSCLTHDFFSSAVLFKNEGVEVEDCEDIYPW